MIILINLCTSSCFTGELTDWYLSDASQLEPSRIALPRSSDNRPSSFTKTFLYGIMKPVENTLLNGNSTYCKSEYDILKVVIKQPIRWSIDSDPEERGIWVQSEYAWYKLIKPSTNKVRTRNGFTSQEEVHLPLRAAFALTSNILDMMDERNEQKTPFLEYHANKSPKESFELLCRQEIDINTGNISLFVPFDYKLLEIEAGFVGSFLNGHKLMRKECRFIQGLFQMRNDYLLFMAKHTKGSPSYVPKKDYDYLKSAENAEFRGRRKPWGSKIRSANEPDYGMWEITFSFV